MNYDYNCGIFPADNVGIEYEVPDDGKREQLKIQRNYLSKKILLILIKLRLTDYKQKIAL